MYQAAVVVSAICWPHCTFQGCLEADSSTESEWACSGRGTMLNGKQGCQWRCEDLSLFHSYRREMCSLRPSNCCGSYKTEEYSSTAQGTVEGTELEDKSQGHCGYCIFVGKLCRDGNIRWVYILLEVSYASAHLIMSLLNNIRSFWELQ